MRPIKQVVLGFAATAAILGSLSYFTDDANAVQLEYVIQESHSENRVNYWSGIYHPLGPVRPMTGKHPKADIRPYIVALTGPTTITKVVRINSPVLMYTAWGPGWIASFRNDGPRSVRIWARGSYRDKEQR